MSVSRALALAVVGLMCMFHATLVCGGSVTVTVKCSAVGLVWLFVPRATSRHLTHAPTLCHVQTKYGKLTGLTSNYTKEFLGVPFATPPGDIANTVGWLPCAINSPS